MKFLAQYLQKLLRCLHEKQRLKRNFVILTAKKSAIRPESNHTCAARVRVLDDWIIVKV